MRRLSLGFFVTILLTLLSPVFADTLFQKTVEYIQSIQQTDTTMFLTLQNRLTAFADRNDLLPSTQKFLLQIATYIETLTPNDSPRFTVTKVVDGDTIRILKNGDEVTIRLIGIDAPESTTTRYGYVECFGKEATTHLQTLIGTQQISLEIDKTQGETDKYGRYLAYVRIDNININQQMIADGYAREYTYNLPYQYQDVFKAAQDDAEANNVGLRNSEACNGERTETTNEVSTVVTGDTTGFTCDTKRYCSEMTSCSEARFYLSSCGLKRIDSDSDGVPCEEVCGG